MPKIKRKFVKEFSSLEEIQLTNDLLLDPNFRVAKFTDCFFKDLKTDRHLSEFYGHENVRSLLNQSLYCFLLVVECPSVCIAVKLKNVVPDIFRGNKKHFLIEIVVKSVEPIRFVRFLNNDDSIERLLETRIDNDNGKDDELSLYNRFSMGCVSESVLEYDLKFADYERFVKDSVSKDEPLLIRLLKCFDFEPDIEFNKTMMRMLVTNAYVSTARAFLDLPIIEGKDDGALIPWTAVTERMLNYKYENDKTLLMIAAKGHDVDIVKLLLRLGMDIQEEDNDRYTVSDYATIEAILKFLLENDARFPRVGPGVLKSSSKSTQEIVSEVDAIRQKFHIAIEDGNKKEIERFRKENPRLKYAYKRAYERAHDRIIEFSQAATTTALLKIKPTLDADSSISPDALESHFEIFILLLENGFCVDNSNDPVDLTDKYSRKVDAMILNKAKRRQSTHIPFLLSKTAPALYIGNEDESFKNRVKEMYEQMNKFREVNCILRLLEHSHSLTIVIDFNHTNITNMVPNAGHRVKGLTYHHSGRIYVCGGNMSDKQIAGVLAQELTHYALNVIYNSDCNPYRNLDEERKTEFDRIVTAVHETVKERRLKDAGEDVIERVYKCYEPLDQPSELIARVPQLIAMGETELLSRRYGTLLNFFNDKVLPDIDSVIAQPEDYRIKREVDRLDDILGHADDIEKRKKEGIWPSKFCDKFSNVRNAQLICCNIPRLFLADVYKTAIESSNQPGGRQNLFIFASAENFVSPKKEHLIRRVWGSSYDITLVIDCESLNEKSLSKLEFLKKRKPPEKFIAFGMDSEVLCKIGEQLEVATVTYDWADIDRESELSMTQVSFQGVDVPLKDLVDDDIKMIPLELLMNNVKIVIETSKTKVDNYDFDVYVNRKLCVDRNVDGEGMNAILSFTKDRPISVLLSDEAGSGKSIVLTHIALQKKEEHPGFWVARINLQEHEPAFAEELSVEMFLKECVVQSKNLDDRNFQEKLVLKLYAKKKLILLLDAVDEIVTAHHYENFKSLLIKLHGNTQLWITTRPHLLKELDEVLPRNIKLKLRSFSKDDEIDCLMKIWKKRQQVTSCEDEAKLMGFAEELIRSFYKSIGDGEYSSRNIGLPLLMKMLAEIYFDDAKQSLEDQSPIAHNRNIDIFQLYEEFSIRKILRATNEKGEEIATKILKSMKHGIFSEILEKLSLKHLFPRTNYHGNIYNDAGTDGDLVIADQNTLLRTGLVSLSEDNRFFFTHKTFPEFFVASFIVDSLWKTTFPDSEKRLALEVFFSLGRRNIALLEFVDKGLRYYWKDIDHSNVLQTLTSSKVRNLLDIAHSSFSTLSTAIKHQQYFIVNFIMKCMSPHTKFYDENLIESGKMCTRFVVAHFLELVEKELWDPPRCRSILAYLLKAVFSDFPDNKLEVIADCTNFDQLTQAQFDEQLFNKILQKPVEERYQDSSLYLVVEAAMKFFSPDEILDWQILRDRSCFGSCSDHFKDSLDMKFKALEKLAGWQLLITTPLFKALTSDMTSDPYDDRVLRLYKYMKSRNCQSFKKFVEHTFFHFFCELDWGDIAHNILQFVRNEMNVDVQAVLENRIDEILPDVLNSRHFHRFFSDGLKYLTREELEVVLTQNNTNGENLVSMFAKREIQPRELETFLLALSRLPTNDVLATKVKDLLNSNGSKIFSWIFLLASNNYVGFASTEKYWLWEQVLNCVERYFENENLTKALQFRRDDGTTIFHVAAKYCDFYVFQSLWHFAKRHLSSEEFKTLLLAKNSDNDAIVRTVDSNFVNEPPSIANTKCEFPSFEFTLLNPSAELPKHAVRYRGESTTKSICIGRVTNSETKVNTVCEIVYDEEAREYETKVNTVCEIVYDEEAREYKSFTAIKNRSNNEEGVEVNLNDVKILLAKGLKWTLPDLERDSKEHLMDQFLLYDCSSLNIIDGRLSLLEYYHPAETYRLTNDESHSEENDCDDGTIYLKHKSFNRVFWRRW